MKYLFMICASTTLLGLVALFELFLQGFELSIAKGFVATAIIAGVYCCGRMDADSDNMNKQKK